MPRYSASVAARSPKCPQSVRPPASTTRTEPSGACSSSRCTARLSPGAQAHVAAGPQSAAVSVIGVRPSTKRAASPAACSTSGVE